MKRVKIMLISMLVLALVGGALAFKVKFETAYCSTPAGGAGSCPQIACPNYTISATTASGADYCTTTPRVGAAAGKECKVADNSNTNLPCINPKVNLPIN